MATVSVPNGTILAVHLQKCSHLSKTNCIEFQYNKTINACTCGEHHNCSPEGCCFPRGFMMLTLSAGINCILFYE